MNIKEKRPLDSPHLYAHHNTVKTTKQSIMKSYSMGGFTKFCQNILILVNTGQQKQTPYIRDAKIPSARSPG